MENLNNIKLPFFTIIIPVYKVEKYLPRCMASILNQDFDSYEVILVDDGSPDLSCKLCDEYADQNPQVKVIHKENGGLSSARNAGIKIATGEYIIFVDSDDALATGTLVRIARKINENFECDMLQVETMVFDDATGQKLSKIETKMVDCMDGQAFLKKTMGATYVPMVWAYVFRSEFLRDNNLFFMNGIFHEDEQFTPRALLRAKRVLTSKHEHYHYYIRANSIMMKKNQTKNSDDLLVISKSLENEFITIADEELRSLLLDRLVSFQLTAFIIGKRIQKDNGIDRSFLKRYAYSKSNRLKVAIYCVNNKLLYWLEIALLNVKRLLRKVELN